jgi:uncharacterized alkaline shock family protein YloU
VSSPAAGAGERTLYRTGAPTDVDGRGRTTVSERVVEKIAARAVDEVEAAAGTPRALLGMRLGSPRPGTRAHVDASVYDGVVHVRVSMSVRWPESVRSVAAAVRARVAEQVETLTGMRVAAVDIEVPTLLTAEESGRVS